MDTVRPGDSNLLNKERYKFVGPAGNDGLFMRDRGIPNSQPTSTVGTAK